jgi:hypothetical protein
MNQCIAAHTDPTPQAPGILVGFINAYELESGNVRLSIRARSDAASAEVVSLEMSAEAWDNFITEAVHYRNQKFVDTLAKALRDA